MTDEKIQDHLSIEQMAAAIIAHKGVITIPASALTESYFGKNIALFYNEEDSTVTFSLMTQDAVDQFAEQAEKENSETTEEASE